MKARQLFLVCGLLVAAVANTACLPLFTEYNLCDKMDAWGKEVPYRDKSIKARNTPFYKLNGIYYVAYTYQYMEESLPVSYEHFKITTEWPDKKTRLLYTETYYFALTPQQVKDYLGQTAAPLPADTPLVVHEKDFDMAAAQPYSLSRNARHRIAMKQDEDRYLPWPVKTIGEAPVKRSFGNYARMPLTYTVGPAANTTLWLGEAAVTTVAFVVLAPYACVQDYVKHQRQHHEEEKTEKDE